MIPTYMSFRLVTSSRRLSENIPIWAAVKIVNVFRKYRMQFSFQCYVNEFIRKAIAGWTFSTMFRCFAFSNSIPATMFNPFSMHPDCIGNIFRIHISPYIVIVSFYSNPKDKHWRFIIFAVWIVTLSTVSIKFQDQYLKIFSTDFYKTYLFGGW